MERKPPSIRRQAISSYVSGAYRKTIFPLSVLSETLNPYGLKSLGFTLLVDVFYFVWIMTSLYLCMQQSE